MTTIANPNDKPVAKLRVEGYGEWKGQVYPLYVGPNYIGRDPDNCNVCLGMPFIAAKHLQIDMPDKDDQVQRPLAMVKDVIQRPHTAQTTLFGLTMRRAENYELNVERILSICGAVNCRMEMLTPEDELVAPTREQHKEFILRTCRGRKYREGTIGIEEYITSRDPYGPGNRDIDDTSSQSVPIHEDDLVTLSMVDATMSLLDESLESVQGSFYSPDLLDDSSRYNEPPDRKHPSSDSDTPATLPYDHTPPSDTDATQRLGGIGDEPGESSQSRHTQINISDAPTQILDPNEHPTFTYDASIDSEHASNSMVEHIAAAAEIVETTQPLGPAEVADDAPTQIQDFGTYLPEIVSNTQSTQEIPSTLSLSRSSRLGSVEPVSQELSQVYPLHTAEHLHSTATRIPSTPVDMLNERSSSKDPEDIQEGISDKHEDDSVSIIPHTQEDPLEGSLDQSTLDISRLSGPSTASAASFEPPGETEHEPPALSRPSSPAQSSPELPLDTQEPDMLPPPLPGTPMEVNPVVSTHQDEDSSSQRTISPPIERSQASSRGTSLGHVQSQEGSPKHSIAEDSDSEEVNKRAKNIKRESTDEGSTPIRRGTPSRTLSRRSTTDLDHRPCVGFSCGEKDQQLKGYENIIKQLQWTKSDDEFSVLVFSSTSRTVKFMTAIVKGIPIVSTSWLDECYKQKRFVSWDEYLYDARELEEKYNFELKKTCTVAKDNRAWGVQLFSGLQFFFIVKAGQSSKKIVADGFLSNQLVKDSLVPIINVCGGKPMLGKKEKEPTEKDKDMAVVIGPEPIASALPDPSWDKTQALIQQGFRVVTKEFILSAILHQKVEYAPYLIPEDTQIEDTQADETTPTIPAKKSKARAR